MTLVQLYRWKTAVLGAALNTAVLNNLATVCVTC